MPREVCVALGGGGARGLAHIGVLAELEQAGYRIAALAGTSMGGVVASLYAIGLTPADMTAFAVGSLGRGLFHFQPTTGGLLGIDRIRDVLTGVLQGKSFADTRCPLALTAVDLDSGTEVVLTSGSLIEAVLATIALPGIFPPHSSGGSRLVDGGVVDPVPVRPVRSLHGGPVVAVSLSARPGSPATSAASPLAYLPGSGVFSRLRISQALQIFGRSLEIFYIHRLRLELDRPEVIVRPDVADIGILDTPEAGPLIEAGREAMAASLSELAGWYGLRRAFRRVLPG
jgi:NTE family protein